MHRQTTVVGQFQGFILVQDRAGREQKVKSPTGGQGIVGGSAGEESQREDRRAERESGTGEQTDRQGLGVGRDGQAGEGRQQEVRRVDQETGTEERTDRQGLDGRELRESSE